MRPRESIEWTRRLLDECGVFAGISSGAAMAGAAKMAAQHGAGTIVTLLPDGGWKYLSSGAWTDDSTRSSSAPPASTTGESMTASTADRARGRRAAAGGLVAFPTETVYGLGADASDRRRGAPAVRGEGPARPTIR